MNRLHRTRYQTKRDLEFLYQIMASPEEQILFIRHGAFNSLQEFDGWLNDRFRFDYPEFFILCDAEGAPAGFCYNYEQQLRDGHCKVTLCLAEQYRNQGLGAFAALEFMHYLFRCYPFRRLYFEVYDYNQNSVDSLRQCGMEETGRMPEYRYYNGAYADLVLLSITKQSFYEKWKRLFGA